MPAGVFNVAKGRASALYDRVQQNDPAAAVLLVVPVSRGAVTDSQMADFATLAAVLAGGVTERTTNGWARKTLTDADIVAGSVDNTNNWRLDDLPDQTWTAVALAGGAITDVLICYYPGAGGDSATIPLTWHPAAVTPDGSNVIAQIAGYYKAS
jgi:hypothetical protein